MNLFLQLLGNGIVQGAMLGAPRHRRFRHRCCGICGIIFSDEKIVMPKEKFSVCNSVIGLQHTATPEFIGLSMEDM